MNSDSLRAVFVDFLRWGVYLPGLDPAETDLRRLQASSPLPVSAAHPQIWPLGSVVIHRHLRQTSPDSFLALSGALPGALDFSAIRG
jgi:hypothetical protein